jgi:glutathione peroxidase
MTFKTCSQRRAAVAGFAAVFAMSWAPTFAQTKDAPAKQTAAACPALLNHTFNRLQDDKPQPLCQYAGRAVLIVNTASKCGYTPQYEGLEALHAKYAARGLVVMGFPSNDFGHQEPGSSRDIAELCFNTYGVRFAMFAKSPVVGPGANPLFAALAQATGKPPRWNFHKYLLDRQGQVAATFASDVAPQDARLVRELERVLAAP